MISCVICAADGRHCILLQSDDDWKRFSSSVYRCMYRYAVSSPQSKCRLLSGWVL